MTASEVSYHQTTSSTRDEVRLDRKETLADKWGIEEEKQMGGNVVWFEIIKFLGGFSATTSDSYDLRLPI